MITIRESTAEDIEGVLDLTLRAYREYKEGLPPGGWDRYSESIKQTIFAQPHSSILLACDDEEILGSVLFCLPGKGAIETDLPEMRLLAISPQHRGKGIAALLIDECERLAAPYKTLTLHTTRLMQVAKGMYERRGYERFPEIDFEPAPGFIVWGYKKSLGTAANMSIKSR